MPAVLTHHRFSVADYTDMIEQGILGEDARVELLRGEVVQKMSIGDLHAATVKILNRWFGRHLPETVLVGVQDPIQLEDSRPEPDLVLLHYRDDYYAAAGPQPGQIFLVVEVADTSLDLDREIKGPLYAENGIPEYWIVNLNDDTLEVYRQPQATGYANLQVLRRGDSIALVAFPDISLAVETLFR